MHGNKLALFDFCGTIVSIQSADRFIDFVREHKKNKYNHVLEVIRIFLVNIGFFFILNKLFPYNNLHKRLKLYQLKGIKKSSLEKLALDYYKKILKHSLIPEIISELKQKQRDQYKTVIVSGGYSIYINYFSEDYNIDLKNVIATDISFDKNYICDGRIEGVDCVKRNKIVKLKRKIKNIENYNLKDSYAYSDSITDLPLLKFVGKGIVVSKKSQPWIKFNNFKVIMWK
jgi:HAD superfamily hydrolase (TIGR01490 family)